MRILLVSHLFPPEHRAGTELYTAELAVRLAQRGHALTVFTTRKDVGREDLSVRERTHRGLRVVELTNNLYCQDFRETWERPAIEARFGALLDELRPEVVHFQHLLYLSVGCLELAHSRGAAVLMTLHDFWLECPRLGQLVHADGSICERVEFERCGTCLPSYPWRQSAAARLTGRAIARVHALTGLDLAPLARGAARAAQGRQQAPGWKPPPPEEARRFEQAARQRSEGLRERVVAAVDRFLSPSRFLRERMVAWGIPAGRIFHLPSGVDRDAFAPRETPDPDPGSGPDSGRLQITFLGTLVPLKGAHVLLEAWGRLTPEERGKARLSLFGPDDHAPEYVASLRERATELGVAVGGALDREGVAAALGRTDLLVVPSLWYENRPLIVLEALCARVPVLASDLGGMAEVVEEDVSGWRFPAGDGEALAGRLRQLLADPAPLGELDFQVAELLPGWDELTDRTLAHYLEIARGGLRRADPGPGPGARAGDGTGGGEP